MEPFPWPVSLGIAGFCLTALLGTIIYYSRKIGNSEWVPAARVDKQLEQKDVAYAHMVVAKDAAYANMVAEKDRKYDDMVIEKDKQIAALSGVKDEWRGAHALSETARSEEREINRGNSEAFKTAAYFFGQVVPKRIDDVTTTGDNAPKEGVVP